MLHDDPLRDFHRSKYRSFSQQQIKYLEFLKQQGVEPNVIYDIGTGFLHWVREARRFWTDASYVLFEDNTAFEFLYREYVHHVGMVTHIDDIVFTNMFPLPDFVKIDAGDKCLDIFLGARLAFSHAKYILMELQNYIIPEMFDVMKKHGWELMHSITHAKTKHVDYIFINVRMTF